MAALREEWLAVGVGWEGPAVVERRVSQHQTTVVLQTGRHDSERRGNTFDNTAVRLCGENFYEVQKSVYLRCICHNKQRIM